MHQDDAAPTSDGGGARARRDRAWANAAHWNDGILGIGGLYFSKEDDRLIVPKRQRWLGWTINLGHELAPVTLVSLIAFVGIAGAVSASQAARAAAALR